ncbi:MAG: rhodanese-like domain-containing protein [Alphaproteobacteria bacterium]|nr:rhodanese-like domain-containing protein [Alphaproteobacteria bacterium]
MKKPSQTILILGLSILMGPSVWAKDSQTKVSPQDTKAAAEFFRHELNFKTNPHGVNSAIKDKQKNITIVDVRSAEEFAKGHIPGAINLPWDKYNGFDGPDTTFPELRKDGYNYVYCYQLLCNLSQKAAVKFASLGYPVKEMVGGFAEWEKEKYPIEK